MPAPRHTIRLAVLLGLLGMPLTGASGDEYRVDRATLPAPLLEGGKVHAAIEASAIEAIGDGALLLVAHDKTTELFAVETATGKLVGPPITCSRFPNGAAIAPKWEGLARDAEGRFYVTGTYGGKADDDRRARSFLFRFRLTGGANGGPLAIDESSVRRWRLDSLKEALAADVAAAAGADLRKIEGLAVRTLPAAGGKPARTELVVGLRLPDDQVRAFAADISGDPDDGAALKLSLLFRFDPGLREGVRSQLTSLEYVPEWNGFFILTATEDADNAFHGNTLWFLPDARLADGPRAKPDAVHVFEPAQKAEGLCVLPDPTDAEGAHALRVAISFDNDPHTTHIPSRLQVVTLSRRADGASSARPTPPGERRGLDRD